jgi:hypothetical protein
MFSALSERRTLRHTDAIAPVLASHAQRKRKPGAPLLRVSEVVAAKRWRQLCASHHVLLGLIHAMEKT